MSLSVDTVMSYVNEMSMSSKIILGGTSLFLIIRWMTSRNTNVKLPPGPFALPFLGNLLSMRKKAMETVVAEWQRKFGPIFTIYLGPMRTVVVTDIDLITEALVKQGSDVSGRPFLYSLDKMTEGSKDISSASYSELWKFQRKVAVHALRQYLSGKHFEQRVHEVMQAVIQNMDIETGPVDLHMHTSLSVFNILHGLCFEETFDYDDPIFTKLVESFDNLRKKSGNGFLEDFLPPMRMWPSRKFTEVMTYVERINDYINKRMGARRANFDEGSLTCLADNVIHAEKLSQAEGQHEGRKLTDTHTTKILFNVFGGGVDTMRVTLDWIFLVLAKMPDIQARVQEEIDSVVGNNIPGREHRSKLIYTEAVIYETMRLYTAAPYALPHSTMCDTSIGGYQIPANTTVLLSMLSVLKDPQHWEDPLTFKPERFLDETQTKIEMRGKSFIPFSMGHRTCPGEGLAKLQILYIVAGFLRKFTFSLPPGDKTDMGALVQGFANQTPDYKVLIKRR